MKLASGIAPVQELLDAGVTVGIGTDGAASNNDLDMFDEMRDAAMIGKLAADDASAVDAGTVVEMATANGAALLGFDSGRIETGANADLAVIDLDAPHLMADSTSSRNSKPPRERRAPHGRDGEVSRDRTSRCTTSRPSANGQRARGSLVERAGD